MPMVTGFLITVKFESSRARFKIETPILMNSEYRSFFVNKVSLNFKAI